MKSPLPLLSLTFVVAAGCAGMTYRADAGLIVANMNGDVALQNEQGTLNLDLERNDVDGNLNVGDSETSPYIRLEGEKNKHRIRFDGFGIDTEGAGILDGAFGGLVAGSQVSTSMEFFAITGNYGYQIARGKNYRVAVGGEVAFYSLDVGARSAVGRETVQTEGFVPMPFAEVEGLFGPFTVGANAAVMDIDLGDAGGFWFDAEAYLRFQITQRFDVMGGYRYIQTDVEGQAGQRDFEADIYVQGLFATAGVTF